MYAGRAVVGMPDHRVVGRRPLHAWTTDSFPRKAPKGGRGLTKTQRKFPNPKMLNNPLCVKDGRLYPIGTRGTTPEKKSRRDQSHEEKTHTVTDP
jgi:hypothetical protein